MTEPEPTHPPSPFDRLFVPVLTGLSFVLILVQLSEHIMWRDEIRTWQIVRECSNPIAVIEAMKYDAVPVLWNWIVWTLTRFTENPFAMQFLHALIATAVVYVAARFAPFSKTAKVIFALGYYPLFEYAAITRSYSLLFLLLLIACLLISQPRVSLRWLGVVVVLLTQVSIWGMGFGGLITVTAVAKILWTEGWNRARVMPLAGFAFVALVGAVLCVLETRPGPGPTFTATWGGASMKDRMLATLSAVYLAWVPVPTWSEHFWNTNLLDGHLIIEMTLSVLLLVAAVLVVLRRPVALGLLLLGIVGLLAFEFQFKGVARHHGHLFMLLVCVLWLARTTPPWKLGEFFERFQTPFWLAVLGLNAIAGIGAMLAGLSLPFSASWATAEYIKKNIDPKLPIVAFDDYCASPIAQWLGRDIYYPQMNKAVRVNTQNGEVRTIISSWEPVIHKCVELAQANQGQVLLLASVAPGRELVAQDTDAPLTQEMMLRIKVLPKFTNGVVRDEGQYLYLLTLVSNPASSSPLRLSN